MLNKDNLRVRVKLAVHDLTFWIKPIEINVAEINATKITKIR